MNVPIMRCYYEIISLNPNIAYRKILDEKSKDNFFRVIVKRHEGTEKVRSKGATTERNHLRIVKMMNSLSK